jgi:hypothetical protein
VAQRSWWTAAPARRRLAFALLLLAGEALLVVRAALDPGSFFSGWTAWAWLVTTPFLVPFFALQAWRAWRDLRR